MHSHAQKQAYLVAVRSWKTHAAHQKNDESLPEQQKDSAEKVQADLASNDFKGTRKGSRIEISCVRLVRFNFAGVLVPWTLSHEEDLKQHKNPRAGQVH